MCLVSKPLVGLETKILGGKVFFVLESFEGLGDFRLIFGIP
jgi:hypothetical protein